MPSIYFVGSNRMVIGNGAELDDMSAMRVALGEAVAATRHSVPDVPVGAVVVLDGVIIGRGRNQVENRGDPILHAEIAAIRDAVATVGMKRLTGATLFATLEPCLMCAGAVIQARLARVVYGCDDPKAGAARSLYTALSDPRLNHQCKVEAGLLADECSALLKKFFATLRDRGKRYEP